MKIAVLGPLRIEAGGRAVAVTAHKPRAVLATLLLSESKVVPASVLVGELWGGDQPRSAATTVHTYVLQLRKLLSSVTGLSHAEVAATLLQTTSNGFLFRAPPGSLDLAEYERLEHAGQQAMADGDLWEALHLLRSALRLWRGETLANVSGGPVIESAKAWLDQSRETMLTYRIELELRLGRHQQILGELASLVRRYPYHEDLSAQFILALYRSGRRDHALGHFAKVRTAMIDELGLEPTPELGRLADALFDRAPELARMPVVTLPRTAGHARVPALADAR